MRILGCILLSWMLLGCSERSSNVGSRSKLNSWMEGKGKLRVLSTTAMIDDLVGQIVRERVDHLALIVGEIDPHAYELVKGDDEKLAFADIVFSNGLGLEHGASLRYHLQNHSCSLSLGEEIQKRHPDRILFEGKRADPHIWIDLSLWKEAIDPIVETLSKADPEGADFYRENGEVLRRKFSEMHERIYVNLQKIPKEKRFLITSHDAFNYFARTYLASPEETTREEWQKRFAAPEGLAPDGQLSTSDIQKIIDHLIHYRIGVVFPESNLSKGSLKKIVYACREKGVQVKVSEEILYGDAMGSPGSNADSYFKMMEHNATALAKEWQ